MKNKVVVDTNIYLSGTFWQGLPQKVLNSGRDKKIVLFATKDILDEIREKMVDKLNISAEDAEIFIEDILTYTEVVKVRERAKIVEGDPDDDKFFDCALACKADFIVSGDSDLLNVGEYRGIKILTARRFLEELELA